MATMIPDDIQNFTTPGEGIFYLFLQRCAKPDEKYLAWYQPDIAGRDPDFILYSQDSGLVIFEVKDWGLDQIVSADPQFFTLYIEGKGGPRKNPLHQIRKFFGEVMNKIKEMAIWCRKMQILMARSR